MAFPNTITSDGTVQVAGQSAPVRIGAAFYQTAIDTTAPAWRMYKSTDQGVSWSIIGGVGPAINGSNLQAQSSNDGRYIYIVDADPTGVFFQIDIFDTTTDTWKASVVTTNSPTGGSPGLDDQSASFFRASDAELVIVAIPNLATQPQFFLYNVLAQTWSALISFGTLVPGMQQFCIGIVQGPGTELELIMYRGGNGTGIFSRFPLNGSVVGLEQTIYTDVTAVFPNPYTQVSGDGINIMIAGFIDINDTTLVDVLIAPVSSFVWVHTQLHSTGANCLAAIPFVDGTSATGQLLVITGDDQTTVYYHNNLAVPVTLGVASNMNFYSGQPGNLGPGLSGFSYAATGFAATLFGLIAFTTPIPPGPTSVILSRQQAPIFVLPDANKQCKRLIFRKGDCRYVYANRCK